MESVQETSKEGSILPPLNRKPLSNNNNSSLGTLSISYMRRDSSLFADDTCSWYPTAGLIHQVSAARPMKAGFLLSPPVRMQLMRVRRLSYKTESTHANTRKLLLVLPAETLWRCWLRELSMFGCRVIQTLGSGSLMAALPFSFNRSSAKFRTPSTMEERFPCRTRLSGG